MRRRRAPRRREGDVEICTSAFGVLEKYRDLKLSYTYAVGAVIAAERRVDAVFGLGHGFRVMGFVVEPG